MQWPDIAKDTNEFGQPWDQTEDKHIPSLEINFLRARSTNRHGKSAKGGISNPTIKTEITPKTDTQFDQHSSTSNPWIDFIALENQIETKEPDQELLLKLGDSRTYEQIEQAFGGYLQKLESLTGCQLPTAAQIQQLDLLVSQMQEELVQMRQAMAKAFTTRKRTEQQYNLAQSTANNWQPRAQIALQNGDETLAKEALVRQKANASIASILRFSLDLQAPHVDTLKWHIIDLEIKIYEAKNQNELLTALADAHSIKQLQITCKTRLEELETLTSYQYPNKQQIQRLELVILRMQDDLGQIRQTTANVIKNQKSTQHKYNIAQSLVNNWQRRAQMALEKRIEDEQKELSIRQKADANTASCLKNILDLQTSELDLLKSNLMTLEITLSQAKTKKELFKVHASLQSTIDRWDTSNKAVLEPSRQPDILMIKLDNKVIDELD